MRAVTVQRREMHHAAERHVGRQVLDERTPGLTPHRVDGAPHDSALVRGGCAVCRRLPARHHHRLVLRRELLRQLHRHPAAVRDHQPDAPRQGHLLRPLRHDHPAIGQHGRGRLVHAQNLDLPETRVGERLPPHGRPGERMVRAIAIGEPPPPVQLSEDEIHPGACALVLERHELPRRGEQLPAVVQRLVQGAGGVQDVGGDHQVIAVRIEALLHRIPFDVQHAVGDRRAAAGELRFRRREEPRRDVGVRVVEPTGG